MSRITPNRIFFAGFISGMALIVVITILLYLNSQCHHCVRIFGFPFIFWEQFAGNIHYSPDTGMSFPEDFESFYIWSLIGDILFALIFSLGLSFIFRFVWSKIAARKLK